MKVGERAQGVTVAILAAVLFGASTPFSKLLLRQIDPLLLAGLLYLGSGIGLALWIVFQRLMLRAKNQEARLQLKDLPWLAGAIVAGGVVAPILLMLGLAVTPASSASLLLNLEGVLTAVLAWFVFKENFDRRIFTGMAAILAGGGLVSLPSLSPFGVPLRGHRLVGGCFRWAI